MLERLSPLITLLARCSIVTKLCHGPTLLMASSNQVTPSSFATRKLMDTWLLILASAKSTSRSPTASTLAKQTKAPLQETFSKLCAMKKLTFSVLIQLFVSVRKSRFKQTNTSTRRLSPLAPPPRAWTLCHQLADTKKRPCMLVTHSIPFGSSTAAIPTTAMRDRESPLKPANQF